MAKYRPKSDIVIAEPCSQSWEAMHGDSRVRHCAECDRDVHNLAAMTPSQIEALAADPASLPCLRIARYEDGSLLVAEEARQSSPYGLVAGAAMAALVSISGCVANAQRTIGKVTPRLATYSARVVDAFGKPVPHAAVRLTRNSRGWLEETKAETNAAGEFEVSVDPGDWQMQATSGQGTGAFGIPLHLLPGEQKADKPVTLQSITVTAGVPAIAPADKPAKLPKK